MYLIGDVKGKDAIIIDDMIDTAGTLVQAADALKREGARRILACAVHPVLSGPAMARIEGAPLEELVVTNSIPLGKDKQHPQDHGSLGGAPPGGGDPAHPRRGIGIHPVRVGAGRAKETVMNIRELSVEPREALGKGAVGRLRRSGLVPAILYGAGNAPVPLAVVPDRDAARPPRPCGGRRAGEPPPGRATPSPGPPSSVTSSSIRSATRSSTSTSRRCGWTRRSRWRCRST